MTDRRWNVAKLRPQPESVEVMFYESARIYRLLRSNPEFEQALGLLQRGEKGDGAVGVELSQDDEEVIDSVEP